MNLPGRPCLPSFSRLLVRALAPAALLLLSACSILPKPAPVDVYLLPAATPPNPAAAQALPWSLRVTRPASSGLLAGQRILVLPQDNRISYYKGANWSDPAPVLLRNRLLDALRSDGRIAALSNDDRILNADFELDSDLRAFQSEYHGGNPQALVRLDVRLVRPATQRIVASRRFEMRQPASGTAVTDVVTAFGAAADGLAAELADWTVAQMAAAR